MRVAKIAVIVLCIIPIVIIYFAIGRMDLDTLEKHEHTINTVVPIIVAILATIATQVAIHF
ncbi:hypothetical protein Lac3_16880 [Claveliimonas bilis]|nr:hypothetical protein Lac3_16880 [Claveliimonas bilis]